MNREDYEYDPEYQAAYRETMEYQHRRLGYAIQDMGNEIAKGLVPVLKSTSSMLRAVWSEFHADQVVAMGRLRLWWHVVTDHRR